MAQQNRLDEDLLFLELVDNIIPPTRLLFKSSYANIPFDVLDELNEYRQCPYDIYLEPSINEVKRKFKESPGWAVTLVHIMAPNHEIVVFVKPDNITYAGESNYTPIQAVLEFMENIAMKRNTDILTIDPYSSTGLRYNAHNRIIEVVSKDKIIAVIEPCVKLFDTLYGLASITN